MHHRTARARSPRALPALLLAAAFASACGGDTVEPQAPIEATLQGVPGSLVIQVDVFCPFGGGKTQVGTQAACGTVTAGDSIHFIAYEIDATGNARELKGAQWAVGDESVATVSQEGWVRGRHAGEVNLSAAVGPRIADTLIAVESARIDAVRLASGSAPIPVGGSAAVTGTLVDVLGNELPAESLDWIVLNPSVATVDEAGTVHGLEDGHVIVIAFGPDNSEGWLSLQVGTGVPSRPAFALADVSVGHTHTCGLGTAGETWCWGSNFLGQLGQGTSDAPDEFFSTPVRVRTTVPFQAVTTGGLHSCGLSPEGAVLCWGSNINGQAGIGSDGNLVLTPTEVAGGARYRAISGGVDHTCAIGTDGVTACWGVNANGQLGNGTFTFATVPTPVATSVKFAQIRAGIWHTCALDASGLAWCWGDNSNGQLGNGRFGVSSSRLVPTAVRVSERFTTIEATSSHTCGLTAVGQLFCWGRNDEGQLGNGNREWQTRPVRVNSPVAFVAVATGTVHTCGLTSDGVAWCWGNNDEAQLGDNSLQRRLSPGPVATALRFVRITAAENSTCGQTLDGSVHCWGANGLGQLGAGFAGFGLVSGSPLPLVQP